MDDYKVNDKGVIVSPGKFQGEPRWVPFYWSYTFSGLCELTEQGTFVVYVENGDIEEYPDLQGTTGVEMWEDDNGFVHHRRF